MLNRIEKQFGKEYTPFELADYMAFALKQAANSYLKKQSEYTILDPACGEGSLLQSISMYFSNYKAIGIDVDSFALNRAKSILNSSNTKLYQGDFIANLDPTNLFANSNLKICKNVDMVIANPPYISTTVLGAKKSQQLAEQFNLKGKIDMYYAFIIGMTQVLKENGLICFITSNKYLTNKSGHSVRKFLNKNYKILKIIDLGDTKLFSAAVLPAIFVGYKSRNADNSKVKFTRIYETNNVKTKFVSNCSELFTAKSGYYKLGEHEYEVTTGILNTSNAEQPWHMASEKDNNWATELEKRAYCTFKDIFEIHVGIKTTADNVFIRNDWNKLNKNIIPEKQVLHKLISSRNISKWITSKEDGNQILYTHKIVNGKKTVIDFANKYPRAWKYLKMHKNQLARRTYLKKAHRKWYEIWVPQDPEKLIRNKIVFPDIHQSPCFCYDNSGTYVDGNCYWAVTKKGISNDYLLLATAVANSKIMAKYHRIKFQNVLYSGRKRYITQYVNNYLLPDIQNQHSKIIIDLMRLIVKQKKCTPAQESKLNFEVERAFNLNY